MFEDIASEFAYKLKNIFIERQLLNILNRKQIIYC